MIRKIEMAHIEMLQRVRNVLDSETEDPVLQQVIIELLGVGHASRMKDAETARFVVDSMHRHMCQMLQEITIEPSDE